MLRQPVSSVLESDESESKMTGSRRLPQVEFRMIQLMEAQGIPVPHMLWVEPTGTWLERPFAVGRWIEHRAGAEPGVPLGRGDAQEVPDARGVVMLRPPLRRPRLGL